MSNVPPTRQELLITKRKSKVASRSKKLLEDKRNSLIQKFMAIIKEAVELRSEFEKAYKKAYQTFEIARSLSDKKYFDLLPEFADSKLEIATTKEKILGVDITKLEISKNEVNTSYSKLATNKILDESIDQMKTVSELLLKTLELESTARSLSEEIIKTRRRVNSLEHIILPDMQATIKDIKFKLAQLDQEKNTLLMRLK